VLRRLILGLVIVLLLVGGGLGVAVAGGWLLHDSAKPASVSAAVTRLRTSGAKGEVFVYATRGTESLNAFVSARHIYPVRTAVTVIATACGERLTWSALEGRSTSWTLCRTGKGLELRREVEVHSFFGRRDRTSYSCKGALLRPGGGAFRCQSARGRVDGEMRSLGTEQLTVGGRRLGGLHVREIARVAGGDGGREATDWWLQPGTGLPLRLAFTSRTSRSLEVGRAHYREHADLRLVSTGARR
jgi:hypothetical protein